MSYPECFKMTNFEAMGIRGFLVYASYSFTFLTKGHLVPFFLLGRQSERLWRRLVNISSGIEVDGSTADGILNAKELGDKQFIEFCKGNLFTDDPDIFNMIKKNKLKTFSSNNV